jgi:hypothetical protein
MTGAVQRARWAVNLSTVRSEGHSDVLTFWRRKLLLATRTLLWSFLRPARGHNFLGDLLCALGSRFGRLLHLTGHPAVCGFLSHFISSLPFVFPSRPLLCLVFSLAFVPVFAFRLFAALDFLTFLTTVAAAFAGRLLAAAFFTRLTIALAALFASIVAPLTTNSPTKSPTFASIAQPSVLPASPRSPYCSPSIELHHISRTG